MSQEVLGGVKSMLHENGIPEGVVEDWYHLAELGMTSLVSLPEHYTTPFPLPEPDCPTNVSLTQNFKLVMSLVFGISTAMYGAASCWQMEHLPRIFQCRDSRIARSLLM